MKQIWIIAGLLALCGCNTITDENYVDEDYGKLFPPKAIEKPENKRGELHVQLCDPDRALKDYKYPGTEVPAAAEQYKITLTCSFEEKDMGGIPVAHVYSRYEVKYINAKKELVTIGCATNNAGSGGNNNAGAFSAVMRNGEKLEISFNVYSGFPLYLGVTGEGPRGSAIKANIKAVSSDGLIEIPALVSEQYQNEDGVRALRYPYCEYIVLP